VIAVRKSSPASCPANQLKTAADGAPRISSEMTLVSIRIKDQSNSGAARIGARSGTSRSMSPKGTNRSWIAWPRLTGLDRCPTTCRKIWRASSSIDRPCSAARTRRRRFSASSRLRIVMLAKVPSVFCANPKHWLHCNQAITGNRAALSGLEGRFQVSRDAPSTSLRIFRLKALI